MDGVMDVRSKYY